MEKKNPQQGERRQGQQPGQKKQQPFQQPGQQRQGDKENRDYDEE
jgi:hypothetical protein